MSDDELSRRSLLDLFREEAQTQTRTLAAGLLALEATPNDDATLEHEEANSGEKVEISVQPKSGPDAKSHALPKADGECQGEWRNEEHRDKHNRNRQQDEPSPVKYRL